MWLAPTCPPGIWQRCLVWFAFPRFEAVQGLAPKMHQKMEHQTLEEVECDLDFVRMTMTTKIIGGTFGSCWASCYFLLEAGMRFRWYTSTSLVLWFKVVMTGRPVMLKLILPGTIFSGTWEHLDVLRARHLLTFWRKVWRPCSSMECLFQGSHMWWRGIALWDTRHQRVARVSFLMPTREIFGMIKPTTVPSLGLLKAFLKPGEGVALGGYPSIPMKSYPVKHDEINLNERPNLTVQRLRLRRPQQYWRAFVKHFRTMQWMPNITPSKKPYISFECFFEI